MVTSSVNLLKNVRNAMSKLYKQSILKGDPDDIYTYKRSLASEQEVKEFKTACKNMAPFDESTCW